MINSKIILAGMFIAGLFFASCGAPEVKKPEVQKPVKLETVQLDTMPFDCEADSMIPLGFIDNDWVYKNQRLGISFRFPKEWNAVEDIGKNNPNIVAVGGDLGEFRDIYTHPHSLKLEFMVGNAWGEKRYLFGITKVQPLDPMDETPLDFGSAPTAMAEVFYGSEFGSEKNLYNAVINTTISQWENSNNRQIFDLNKPTIRQIKEQRLGNAVFYRHSIKIPSGQGIISATTLVKKLDCIFLVLSFTANNKQQEAQVLKALEGIAIKG